MAISGRKPKPTHLKLLEGRKGNRKLNKNEPKPSGDLLEPPDHLTEQQKTGWAYAIAHSPPGLLKKLDRAMLAIWCIAEDLHRQAAIAVNNSGLIVKSPIKGEPMQNPFLAILNKQAMIMMKAEMELGFSPTSRSRITVGDHRKDSDDSFDDF